MNWRQAMIVSGAWLSGALLWPVSDGLPRAAAAEIPEPVRQPLESNAKALTPLTLAWERTRKSDLPADRARRLFDNLTFLPETSRFSWDGERFYTYVKRFAHRSPGDPKSAVDTFEIEISFDGKNRYCGTKRTDVLPTLVSDAFSYILRNDREMGFLDTSFFPLLGFHLPNTVPEWEAKRPAKSYPLYLVENGARVVEIGREEIDGASMPSIVLHSNKDKRDIRFTLDPAKGYALRRRTEWARPGEVVMRADCLDFAQLPASKVWLPQKVVIDWHTWPGVPIPTKEPVIRETFTISELSDAPIPPERYALKFQEKGTMVADSTVAPDRADRLDYRMPADPSDLDEVIRAAQRPDYQPRRRPSIHTIFIVANVVGISTLAIVAWWRLRGRPREDGTVAS